MRGPARHRPAPAARGRLARLAAALAALAAMAAGTAALARDATVTGTAMPGYARIAIEFDQPTKVQVRAANGVLVVSFGSPARIVRERLLTDLPAYVSVVRRDPDDTGLRVALTAAVRTNVLEAGETIFVDLLPPGWAGMPPGLPPEIVAKLAERARAAEARLARQDERVRAEAPKPVALRMATLPTLTRLTFEPPAGTPSRIGGAGDKVELTFDGPTALALGGEKPRLAPGIAAFDVVPGASSVAVRLTAAPGYRLRSFQDEGVTIVDLSRPVAKEPAPAEVDAAHVPAEPSAAHADAAGHAATPAADAHGPPDGSGTVVRAARTRDEDGLKPILASAGAPAPAAHPPSPSAAEAPPPHEPARRTGGTVAATFRVEDDAASVVFPFPAPVAAAGFDQAGRVTLVFATLDRIALPASGDVSRFFKVETNDQDGGIALVRLALAKPRQLRLAPEGTGWRLILGGREALPPDPLVVTRNVEAAPNGSVTIGLRQAGGVHWFVDPDGERIAAVTAFGRPQGLPRPSTFVEFELAASLQGVVVRSRADDLRVALAGAGVAVSSAHGLALSPGRDGSGGPDGIAAAALMLPRGQWQLDQAGDVLVRNNELLAAAATAPRAGRAEARAHEARMLLANGLNHEAAAVLALARFDDPVFARRREASLLAAIAAVRSRRLDQARTLLAAETLADDPEAALWRALVDAGERRWGPALKGFARAGHLVEQYPDEVAGWIRLTAFDAAMATGDLPRAEAELTALDGLPSEAFDHERQDLARARLDEAAGRVAAADKVYASLVANASRPVAARAGLRALSIAIRTDAITAEEAVGRLEALAVAWRGDEVELGAMMELSRLYAKLRRWRDVFAQMRVADRLYPTHEMTRAMHDEAARLFETILLESGPDTKLTPVEALAIYFDFKELAPVGRRGDEIVRRLADRLVELDLLDQAAELLQYQVDKRLTGAARASVAARLAAIRLLNGKPTEALAALHATRLSNLPDDLRDFRLLLEAQALADLTRVDLALEVTEGEAAPEFKRLRAGILWTARRWREAGEAYEALAGRRWQDAGPLSDRDRTDVLRAAVAYGFAGEALGRSRLRSKFGAKLADSPDARSFEQLLLPGAAETRDFRSIALSLSKGDALKSLLADWRETHPDPTGDARTSGESVGSHSAPAAGDGKAKG